MARLFEPLTLKSVTTRNRIVISPMCQYSAKEGLANDWHFAHLSTFALGGAGIIFTEATAVLPEGRITHGDLGLWSDEHAAALRPIVAFLKQQGAQPAIQLAHAGRKASMQRPWYGNGPLEPADIERGDLPWEIVGPSTEPVGPNWLIPHELDQVQIRELPKAFAEAAQRALSIGFTIAEVHGAHGYLLHSFLSPVSNKRTDQYGGSMANRMRLPLEVTEAVRNAWPEELPLFFRVSAIDGMEGGWELEDSVSLAKELRERGVDVIDCSSRGIAGPATVGQAPALGHQVPFSERIRREAGLATMAVGLIIDPQQAEKILAEGKADLVALAREALRNPFWPHHAYQSLVSEQDFSTWPVQYGWWLERRRYSRDNA